MNSQPKYKADEIRNQNGRKVKLRIDPAANQGRNKQERSVD